MDKAQALLMQRGLQGRAAPGLAQQLLDLGVYYMPQPRQVFGEGEVQPRAVLGDESTSTLQELMGQIEGARRYMNGPATDAWAEDLHSQRNFNSNILRGYSPYLGQIKV